MYVKLNENQRGFLFEKGKLKTLLMPGIYTIFKKNQIESVYLKDEIYSVNCPLTILLQKEEVLKAAAIVNVGDEQLALHYCNDQFVQCLSSGIHAFWKSVDTHRFTIVNTQEPMIGPDIPRYIFASISDCFFQKVEVAAYEKAKIYYDHKLVKIVESGIYYFWKTKTAVDIELIDMRWQLMDIHGQEVLTKDKVEIRINMICRYRIIDCVKITDEIKDYEEQLHNMIQLVLRTLISSRKIDEILENKDEISNIAYTIIKEKSITFYVEIQEAGIKDIILPGDMRDIMKTILLAEKRAQANVITRREEVASTRSLLNTAKLLEENKVLYRLKELEYAERICENIGTITLNGSQDILSQLVACITRKE